MTIENISIPESYDIEDATCVAIDFETASSSRASACSIGVTWFDDIRIIRTAHRLIQPYDMIFSGFNISIHGIYPEDVEDEPEFPEIWQELLPLIKDRVVLAHNAAFDMSVLRASLDRYELPWPELSYLCTVKIARAAWPELPNHKLPTVSKHIEFSLDHHSAASDAEGCASIAIAAARSRGVSTINELPECLDIKMGEVTPNGYSPCSSQNRRN
ncbi:MAG: 3'-5' exonuclease [Rhodospirillales bacterium]|nr:3'-5' exonuclease [Rhodospirillales bacterium]